MRNRIAWGVLKLLTGALVGASGAARAEDISEGVRLPALEVSGPGSATVGTVKVSLGDKESNRAVKLDLEVRGTASGLSLHIPPFGWRGEGETFPERQFPELRVTLDGVPAGIVSNPQVVFDGRDITAEVRAARLDPFIVTETRPLVEAASGAEAAFEKLRALGAVATDQAGNQVARWSAGREIRIPLGGGAGEWKLGLSYAARPGFAELMGVDGRFPFKDYCLDDDVVRRWLNSVAARQGIVVQTFAIPAALGAKPAELHVTLAPFQPVADPGFPGGPDVLRAFCGADRQPVVTGREGVSHDAAAAADGAVQVLVIVPMPPAPEERQ